MGTIVSRDNDVTMKVHGHGVRIRIMSVDPELAKAWIAKEHESNRRVESVTARYTEDMAAGRWRWTPEPIVFDNNDKMVNGGNRLRAIVASGVTVLMTVWFGCPQDVVAVIDRGSTRTLRQADKMTGVALDAALYHMGRALYSVDRRTTSVPDGEVRKAIEALAKPWAVVGAIVPHRKPTKLRAGCLLALCVAWYSDPECVHKFAAELAGCMRHEMAAGSATRNFLRWYELRKPGTGIVGTVEDVRGMSGALRQFYAGRELEYLKPTEESWNHWRRQKQAIAVLGEG